MTTPTIDLDEAEKIIDDLTGIVLFSKRHVLRTLIAEVRRLRETVASTRADLKECVTSTVNWNSALLECQAERDAAIARAEKAERECAKLRITIGELGRLHEEDRNRLDRAEKATG